MRYSHALDLRYYGRDKERSPQEVSEPIEELRPRIGITMRIELETNRFYLARYYSEAVEAAGGLPVHIPLIPSADFINSVMNSLDGLLLPGSDSDMDPVRYGREPHPRLGSVH